MSNWSPISGVARTRGATRYRNCARSSSVRQLARAGSARLPQLQTPEALFCSLGGRGRLGSAGHRFDPQQRFELFAREKLLFKDDVGDLSLPHKGGGELEHKIA